MTSPAARILAAFDSLSEETKRSLGEALRLDPSPIISGLGLALTRRGALAELILEQVLHLARFDPASMDLVESLGPDEPWLTMADAMHNALVADDPDLEIASDV
jgi:hypothetical protein